MERLDDQVGRRLEQVGQRERAEGERDERMARELLRRHVDVAHPRHEAAQRLVEDGLAGGRARLALALRAHRQGLEETTVDQVRRWIQCGLRRPTVWM